MLINQLNIFAMKRFVLLSLLVFSFVFASAQTYKFNAYELSYRYVDDYGYWTDWSDWEDTSILVVISLDREVVSIYSQETQEYDIYNYEGESNDSNGETMTFNCVNEDGLRCDMRIRVQNDGIKQLYIDFSDMSWVYNLRDR